MCSKVMSVWVHTSTTWISWGGPWGRPLGVRLMTCTTTGSLAARKASTVSSWLDLDNSFPLTWGQRKIQCFDCSMKALCTLFIYLIYLLTVAIATLVQLNLYMCDIRLYMKKPRGFVCLLVSYQPSNHNFEQIVLFFVVWVCDGNGYRWMKFWAARSKVKVYVFGHISVMNWQRAIQHFVYLTLGANT